MEVQRFEIKTEADSNDKQNTGMFAVSDCRGLVVTLQTHVPFLLSLT